MILLDTHIWLWWLLGSSNLSEAEIFALDQSASRKRIAISWVSIWETEMLERKGRITLEPDAESWIRQAIDPDYITVLAADIEVVLTQRKLPVSFHNDPADRLITATAMLTGYPLATYDQRIRDSRCCEVWVSK
jgi:PIN domain nuclease of toxin-antitoxin system